MNIKENSLVELVFQTHTLLNVKSPRLIMTITKSTLEYNKAIKSNISLLNVYNDVLKSYFNQNDDGIKKDELSFKDIMGKFQVKYNVLLYIKL